MNPNEDNTPDFAEIVRTQLPALLLFARQWRHGSSEDIVQEAFMRLWEQRELPENITAWLFTAVRNLSNHHLRSEKRRKNRETKANTKNCWFDQENSHDETDEVNATLIRHLEALPFQYREIIVAKIWGKMTLEQIAVIYGKSKSSVHRLYNTGLKILYESIKFL
ncbi:MAG: sigma-70 family RNA polymerase sigma factor [Planctomycetaceae bacterium]|jgi:RNA polymerase sigma-70 factor (ECF subfamily)|nr:sigma-70 family RNA polymerase sigma factor [Planctomycetaceae bacterium]